MNIDVNKYYEKIDQYEDTYLNKEQKILVKNLMDILINDKKLNKYEVDNYFNFFLQRVKTGFTFDEIPKEFSGYISLPKEDKKLSFKGSDDSNNLNHLLFIGENYDVLKSLLITHRNKIDIIYIDPPYNTDSARSDGNFLSNTQQKNSTNKFIYRDRFSRTGWLNMMKERLVLAKDLLSEEGVIFVSIDDNEQAYLKVLMDEIFGEENFISNVFIESNPSGRSDSKDIAISGDFLLIYANNKMIKNFNKIIFDPKETYVKGYSIQKVGSNSRRVDRPNLYYPIYINYQSKKISLEKFKDSIEIFPKLSNDEDGCWIYSKKTLLNMIERELIEITNNNNNKYIIKWLDKEKIEGVDLKLKSSWHTNGSFSLSNSIAKTQLLSIINSKNSELMTPKALDLIKLIIKFSFQQKKIIILDFFAGSGTTGHAVMDLNREDNGNRKFILVTNNENNIAKDICYERLYRIIKSEGTKGEKNFKWLEKNKKYTNNNLKVFNLEKIKITPEVKLNDFLIKKIDEYKKIDTEYKGDFTNIFYDLSSLEQSLKEE